MEPSCVTKALVCVGLGGVLGGVRVLPGVRVLVCVRVLRVMARDMGLSGVCSTRSPVCGGVGVVVDVAIGIMATGPPTHTHTSSTHSHPNQHIPNPIAISPSLSLVYIYNSSRSLSTPTHPGAPQCSSVINTSNKGAMAARPGYMVLTTLTTCKGVEQGPGDAMTAPPTGTMKFLSVLWMTASTRPLVHAEERCLHIDEAFVCGLVGGGGWGWGWGYVGVS